MKPTLNNVMAIRDACNQILHLAGQMDELTLNDHLHLSYAVDLRRRVEGIVKSLEKEQA